jgi:hypothetical protein
MSDHDYFAEARQNYAASQNTYNTLKMRSRMATTVGTSKSVPQVIACLFVAESCSCNFIVHRLLAFQTRW